MNLLKEVLRHQVYPAMGCTEPVSVALCAAHAAKALGEPVRRASFTLDPGTYKNGMGVTLPNTGGEKGSLLAAALGLVIAEPGLGMEILKAATPKRLAQAKALLRGRVVGMRALRGEKRIRVEARVSGGGHKARCLISDSHTAVSVLEKDGRRLMEGDWTPLPKPAAYKDRLRRLTLKDMTRLAARADREDLAYIRKGVDMNLAAAREGMKIRKVGFYLQDLLKKGYLLDDVFSSSKILTACAADARMDGAPVPVMSSGESGNQGIVAILVPYNVGKAFKVPERRILESIAFSHLLNAYVKVFTGGLAPICGCAIAAGVGASAAVVYQQRGADLRGITLAVNNVISDLGGMLCDGAKSGCSLKVVSSTDASIRSAYMGINHYGITELEGFVGRTAEKTIQNLARISTVGMEKVDRTIVDIMLDKQGCRAAGAARHRVPREDVGRVCRACDA